MATGIFWGAFLLLLGAVLIIKVVFNLDFPVGKVIIGIFLVVLGVKLLFGRFGHHSFRGPSESTVFNERIYHNPDPDKEYSVVFAKGVYDFTGVDLSGGSYRTEISTIFGGSQIIIPREAPVRITADAVFSGAELPDGNTAVFGTTVYESESFSPDSAYIDIKLNVVFGGVQVIRR